MINQNHKANLRQRIEELVFSAMRTPEKGIAEKRTVTINRLVALVEEVERSYGNCQACYGKGYSTVVKGTIGYPDFPGDKGFKDPPTTKVKFCACGRGEGLKKLYGKSPVTDW